MIRAVVRVRGGGAESLPSGPAASPSVTNEEACHGGHRDTPDEESEASVEIIDDKCLRITGGAEEGRGSRQFEFSQCFGPDTTQQEFYRGAGVQDIIKHALSGYAATLFSYGATGSGKTFTTFGTDGVEGCFGHAMRTIFDLVETPAFRGTSVRMSSVEIYNDRLVDLLRTRAHVPCKNTGAAPPGLKWSVREKGFVLKNVEAIDIRACEQGLACLRKTVRHRRVAAHALNKESSRSHCITILFLENSISGRYGKIMFCDLAGSERIKKTASRDAKESGGLNKSLLTLSKVVRALDSKSGVKPPYREAALTKLLCSSLGGCSMCVLIACISPHTSQLTESLRTLQFAARTMRIKNTPIVFRSKHERLVEKLRTQIRELTEENMALRQQVEHLSVPAVHDPPATSAETDAHVESCGPPAMACVDVSTLNTMNEPELNDDGAEEEEEHGILRLYQSENGKMLGSCLSEEMTQRALRDEMRARELGLQSFSEAKERCTLQHGPLYAESLYSQRSTEGPVVEEELRAPETYDVRQQSFQEGLYQALFADSGFARDKEVFLSSAQAAQNYGGTPIPRAPDTSSTSSKAVSPRVQMGRLAPNVKAAKKFSKSRRPQRSLSGKARAKEKSKAERLRVRALRDEIESAQVHQVVSNWITHHRTRFSGDFVF
ncbi:Kinesin, putative [Hondaea fermentalgiana]|uniref:Kinesin-like protein n=1 Tax=Hondaea fermentalgiana TaxID=2315210 RepID=A0A2R5GHU4_9STRA|nr:Kinesin, putative [Hondaea fermentalgiana]|eukprot:GBG30452.1 Kinesin, putative [Hondaea fermentalgiana]